MKFKFAPHLQQCWAVLKNVATIIVLNPRWSNDQYYQNMSWIDSNKEYKKLHLSNKVEYFAQ